MASNLRPRYTPKEYLAMERAAEYKSEYLNGEIYAMSGASREHNIITVNVGSFLNVHLKGKPCETYANDMRVKVESASTAYTYPDVVVACGEPHFEDAELDTLLNPTVIIEVLSPSTEAYDRGAKFAYYRQIESLKDYLLISQHQPHIEHYARQSDSEWLYKETVQLEEIVYIASIGCSLTLADVYDRIVFEEEI